MSKIVLETIDLGIDFGGLTAVDNFNIKVKENSITGLIGPNGAGKTTVFNMLTKIYTPSRGKIILNGNDITNLSTIEVNKLGIARTFQNIRLYDNLSVIDNVKTAMFNETSYSSLDAFLRLPKYYKEEKRIEEEAFNLLKIFDLDKKADIYASSLPYGEQRKLEIIRALASKPCLLLLDEPAAGMNPKETLELMNTIRDIRDNFNITILLIEHDMKLVMGICEEITVLNFGMVLTSGSPEEIINNKQVIKAYLGE